MNFQYYVLFQRKRFWSWNVEFKFVVISFIISPEHKKKKKSGLLEISQYLQALYYFIVMEKVYL